MRRALRRALGFWGRPVLAEVLTALGATKMAEVVLRKAVMAASATGDPNMIAAVHACQSSLEERKGNVSDAINLLKRAIAVQPEDRWCYHCELALLYKAQGDFSMAVSEFSTALQLLPPDIGQDFKAQIESELHECDRKPG